VFSTGYELAARRVAGHRATSLDQRNTRET
jgi:hypothetical protein